MPVPATRSLEELVNLAPDAPRSIVERWAVGALQPVALPSGVEVLVRPTTVGDLLVGGLVDVETVRLVEAGLAQIRAGEPYSDESWQAARRLDAVAIAEAVRFVRDDGRWVPWRLDVDELAEVVPPADLELLKARAVIAPGSLR